MVRCSCCLRAANSLVLRKVVLASIFFFLFASPARAIYDPTSVPNNRYGIHVLDTTELEKAEELVNSSGGQWGYVTIPIRANDRDLDKWTKFMQDARRLKIIPILRIASFPVDDHWMAPNEYDLVDFANFLDELPWPTKNRYVVVYNEPNHEGEWGGFVYPEEYARVLDRAIDIFHKRSPDFFVIAAGMDSSAPNGPKSMNEYDYFDAMQTAWPGIFSRIDGFSSHAYGNPGFSSFPNVYSQVNVASYRYETDYLCRRFEACNLKVFLTEAGWRADLVGDAGAANFYRQAFNDIWTENNIVAVTPFLLNAQMGSFTGFSFTSADGKFKDFANQIKSLPKTAGQPQLNRVTDFGQNSQSVKIYPSWTGSLPRILKTDWIGSFVQAFLNMFGRKG